MVALVIIRTGMAYFSYVINRIACMVPCDICRVKNASLNITYVRRHGMYHVNCGLISAIRAGGSRSCNFHVAWGCLQPVSWVCSPPAQNKLVLVQFPFSLSIPTAWLRRDFRRVPQYSLFVPVGYEGTKSIKIVSVSVMYFVWIWEQTAIISLYSINWLVIITDICSVYCAVRTGFCVQCILSFQSPVVTICTTSLTFNSSTFCPHSVCMFCVDLRTKDDYFPIQH